MKAHTQTGQIIVRYVERRERCQTSENRQSGDFVVGKVEFSHGG